MADDPSVRESLSASIDALESGGGNQDTGGGASSAALAPSPDSAGGGVPQTSQPPDGSLYEPPPTPEPAAARSGQLPPAPAQPGAQPAPPAGDLPQLRPPSAWNPEVREKWAGLPPEVQQEVLRRERVIARSLQESSEARRGVSEFMKICEPYRHLIAMEGGEPLRAFGDYLKTMAVLRAGSPQEKAQAIAQGVSMFGVDIRMLDNLLAQVIGNGGLMQMPQAQQRAQPQAQQQFRDPRVDQFIAERTQYAEAQARSEVEDFYNDARFEFLEDVRHDMADMLDLAAQHNRTLTLPDAYHRACMMHPEISKVMQQRQLANTANRQNGQFAAKQRAAGSVTPAAGASSSPNGKALSVREAIEQSISQLAG